MPQLPRPVYRTVSGRVVPRRGIAADQTISIVHRLAHKQTARVTSITCGRG